MPESARKKLRRRVPPAGEGDYTKARKQWNPSEQEVLAMLAEESALLGDKKSAPPTRQLLPKRPARPSGRKIDDYTKAREKWNPSEADLIAALKKRSKALKKRRKAS